MPRSHLRFMVILLVIFFGIATSWLTKPFIGHQDWDNVLIANGLKNYEHHGYLKYRGLQIRSWQHNPPEEFYIYRSTPPTYYIGVSLLIHLFSHTEATIRLVNVFLSMISISLVYQLGKQFYDRRTGLIGAFFFASAPFTIYFATIANWEVVNTIIALLILLMYLRWLKNPQPHHEYWMMGLAFMGVWVFYYIPVFLAVLFVHSLLFGTRHQQRVIFIVGLCGLLGLITWLLYTSDGANPEVIQEMRDKINFRTSNTGADDGSFTFIEYVITYLRRLNYGVSLGIIVLSVTGLYFHWKNYRGEHLLSAMLIAGLIHTTLWRNGTFIHDFFMYSLTAPLAILAAYGLSKIWGTNRQWLPRTRQQRLAGSMVFAHLIIVPYVVYFYATVKSESILTTAELLATHSGVNDTIGTNLEDGGPHVSYYADREVIYSMPADRFNQFELYLFCPVEDESRIPIWENATHIEEVNGCYLVTP